MRELLRISGMAVPCLRCGRSYDVTLFQFGRTIWCTCGERVALEPRLRSARAREPRFFAGGWPAGSGSQASTKIFGAELHLLHCYQLFPTGAAAASYDVMIPESYDRAVRESATTHLSRWREKASAQGVRAEKHIRADIPSHGIIALAQELPADLIVMGTRGLTGIQHVLLGSVAERTVRLAPCPVLTVKHS
jgi:nucleotide-binding universal stress UspA family protein